MDYKTIVLSFIVAYIYNGYAMIAILKNGYRSDQPRIIYSNNFLLKFLFALKWPFIFTSEEYSLYVKKTTFIFYGVMKFIFTITIHTFALYSLYTYSSLIENNIIEYIVNVVGFIIYIFIMPMIYILLAKTILLPFFILLDYIDRR